MSRKNLIGVVYSTNPDYDYQYDDQPEAETLEPGKQRLRVAIERNHRGGKTATLVRGFVGTDDDLQTLAKMLKTRCGVGGSAKDGEIIIQGELADKVRQLLASAGYNVK